LDMRGRVLEVLFPRDLVSSGYLRKLVLRFSDSATQLVVVTYTGGTAELIEYRVTGFDGTSLAALVAKRLAENPNVAPVEIAASLQVDVRRTPINYDALSRSLDELKNVRFSPLIQQRIAVDDYADHEFWYDTWQEAVYFSVVGPFERAPQDGLVRWMRRFRANLPTLLRVAPAKP
jgi:hypothetical protein